MEGKSMSLRRTFMLGDTAGVGLSLCRLCEGNQHVSFCHGQA